MVFLCFFPPFKDVWRFDGLNLDGKYIANPFLTLPRAPNGLKSWFKTDFLTHVGPQIFHDSGMINKKNGHETDLEMSPRPLGTTVFEEINIRTMGK